MPALKTLEALAVGDWVVVDSLILSRHISAPWKVEELAKSRVYVGRYAKDPVTGVVECRERKFFARKSIRFVFEDEETANTAYAVARSNSEAYEAAARELQKIHTNTFKNYMAQLGGAAQST